jgi:DNA-binding response OmpR family regulator
MNQHRILVVEDDPDTQDFYEFLLTSEGYDVTMAPDGQIALARATDTHVVGILLDQRLPDISGVELCCQLRALLAPTMPIFFLSGDHSLSLREQAMTAGVTAFLLKPFEPDALLALLAAHGLGATA